FTVPAFISSSIDMLNKWEKLCGKEGSCEVNVWPYLRELSADAISRAAFGNSYEEGNRVFELITEQVDLIRPILKSIHIPGWRLYPPIAGTIRRVCEEVKLGDNVLPEGVIVRLSNNVHQNKNLWGVDAKEFNPNRFKDGLSKASGGNVSLFSFGWGPRNCIGSNFAMIEAKVALVLILQRFSLKLSSSYEHGPIAKETIQPQFGAQIILKPLAN
ncbi:hypothetical protein KSS87_016913, partial [Heliosperma pusillum]